MSKYDPFKRLKETTESHPAMVAVQFSRVHGTPPQQFFGSSVKSSSWIRLTIQEAERGHQLGSDHISAHGGKYLLQLDLSPNQFAELLTTMNAGPGVPGTLKYYNGKEIEDYVEKDAEGKRVHENFQHEI